MGSGIVAASALICGMIALKLMATVERAQVIVAGRIGSGKPVDRVVAIAVSTRKLFAMRLAVAFFSRLCNIMFLIEGMYAERGVQKTMASMMNTVVTSTRVKVAAHHTRHAARHARQRLMNVSGPRRVLNKAPVKH